MSQADIQEFLEEERKLNDKWFTSVEIKKKFKEQNKLGVNGVYDDLMRLSIFNIIECKGEGFWKHKKKFRGKKDDCKKDKH